MIAWQKICIISTFFFLTACLHAQERARSGHLDHLSADGVDITSFEYSISDSYTDQSTGITYTYLQQLKEGVPIYKALAIIAEKDNAKVVKTSRLTSSDHIVEKKNTTSSLSRALQIAFQDVGFAGWKSNNLDVIKQPYRSTVTHPEAVGLITIEEIWGARVDGMYERSHLIDIQPKDSDDHWLMVISESGEILDKLNQTRYCAWEGKDAHSCGLPDHTHHTQQASDGVADLSTALEDGSSYNVFAVPLESPSQGERTIVTDPADEIASPFGWHDTDNQAGPEFLTLRGNNVIAYQDTLSTDEIDMLGPSGGANLQFDFDLDISAGPEENLGADLTNLFYWNNYMHDWSYRFGFTEVAGNFQTNTYGRGGIDSDPVLAESLDGSSVNNASFSAPRDGRPGRMQMFKWKVGTDLIISQPEDIAGIYRTGAAGFGPLVDAELTGDVVYILDDRGAVRDGCDEILNSEELAGNIALIDRGLCDFSFKVYQAQQAGATACIVCNNLQNAQLITMGAGMNAEDIEIPSLFLSREDCSLIKARLEAGVQVEFGRTREISSSFDNGIIVHEYGHGISLRLVGGPSTSGCLQSDEEMGEGWSDFFALVVTQQETDQGGLPRGIATFLRGESRTDTGIRRYPYSTDMDINPQVHSHIRYTTRPHDVGEIWASVLWDMYWRFIDIYGYDSSWEDPTSGNAIAIQLVMDGMKLQICDATLTQARDAILEADELNFFGMHKCMIWEVFARRGLGVDAFGGDLIIRYDNIDGFEVPLSCSGVAAVEKTMTEIIDAGQVIDVSLHVSNYDTAYANVSLVDKIPANTAIINIMSDVTWRVEGDEIMFNMADLAVGEEMTVSYQLATSNISPARSTYFDDLQGEDPFSTTANDERLPGWELLSVEDTTTQISLGVSKDVIGGNSFAEIETPLSVTADGSIFLFDHAYNADLGIDGGVVEISKDNGVSWQQVTSEEFLIHPPEDVISDCFTNCPIPDYFYRNEREAFTGVEGRLTSVIDLSDHIGEEVRLRFHYISLRFVDTLGALAWQIHEFEQLERKEISSQASLFSGDDMIAEDVASTLVRSDRTVDNIEETFTEQSGLIDITPNPASDIIRLSINLDQKLTGSLQVYSTDGRQVLAQPVDMPAGMQTTDIDVSSLPPGLYVVEVLDQRVRYSDTFVLIDE